MEMLKNIHYNGTICVALELFLLFLQKEIWTDFETLGCPRLEKSVGQSKQLATQKTSNVPRLE